MNEDIIIENAIIKSADFQFYSSLTFFMDLDYGGAGQAFGGYTLYIEKQWKNRELTPNYCGRFLSRCLKIAGSETLGGMIGKPIRVKRPRGSGAIMAIGHFLEDDWFDPQEDFKEMIELEEKKKSEV